MHMYIIYLCLKAYFISLVNERVVPKISTQKKSSWNAPKAGGESWKIFADPPIILAGRDLKSDNERY